MSELELGSVGFWGEGKTRKPEKNLLELRREPTTTWTQPSYELDAGIWNLTTLVIGECSHHCATLAPLKKSTAKWLCATNVTGQRKVKLRVWRKCFKPNSPFTARHIVGHPTPSTNVETRPKLTLGTCQKLAGGGGGWEFYIWVRKWDDPSLQWEWDLLTLPLTLA